MFLGGEKEDVIINVRQLGLPHILGPPLWYIYRFPELIPKRMFSHSHKPSQHSAKLILLPYLVM